MMKAKLRVALFLALSALACASGLGAAPVPTEASKQLRTDLYGDPLPTGALARLGTLRLRRDYQSPSDFAFTPNGKALVSAKTDKILQFWDVKTGEP
jgi:WD40 repeat protein